jgi:prophage DNA circulation protein
MWYERLQEAAITTPDNERYVFLYEDVSQSITKKTSTYQFSDVEGTKVQDFGLGSRSLPQSLYFSGSDYDEITNAFLESSSLAGTCTLEHPRYGNITVSILSISVSESFTTNSNQSKIELEMIEAIDDSTPTSSTATKKEVDQLSEEMLIANAEDYESIYSDVVSSIESTKTRVLSTVAEIKSTIDSSKKSALKIASFIENNIDTLKEAPKELAISVQRLILEPTKIVDNTKNLMRQFSGLLQTELFPPDEIAGGKDYQIAAKEKQFKVTTYLTALSNIMLNGSFVTKKEATESVQMLLTNYQQAQEYLDTIEDYTTFQDNRFVVDSLVARKIKEIIGVSSINIVKLSFSLKQERIIKLDRVRYLIELVYELYGETTEETIDFFITSNSLTAQEILELPKGKEILYYVG